MRLENDHLTLTATDLSRHLGCRHATQLNLRVARGELERPPYYDDPVREVLQARGQAHEQAFLQRLRDDGKQVVELPEHGAGVAATLAAMRDGAEVIAQATLDDDRWRGRADFLLRVDAAGANANGASDPGDSALGNYHYEIADTKLAQETKAGTLLQLCLYADLLAGMQGRWPERVMVVTPGGYDTPEAYRVDHYRAYYERVKARLAAAVTDGEATYPEPCEQCNLCDWWRVCYDKRHDDDHLSLVANITRGQRTELTGDTFDTHTLTRLGEQPLPPGRPRRGSREGLEKAQHQAAVQLRDRASEAPYYEMLSVVDGEGLCRLPAPSAGDVFFDLEGDPFAGDGLPGSGAGGLEYLFGWACGPCPAPDTLTYHHTWADDAAAERAAFETFVDQVMARRDLYPQMHVYHYAPYEPAALKRLMGRYATREVEVDDLLRNEVFVDLFAVTRQAVRAGVESYSIKRLERFFGYDREVDLPDVSRPKRSLEALLEAGRGAEAPDDVREIVRGYNEDDCVSTWRLREWLEARRDEVVAAGEPVPRPAPEPKELPEEKKERDQRVEAVRALLLDGLDERPPPGTADEARWRLAHMLDWHWRELKASLWEKYRLRDLGDEDYLHEKAALGGLVPVEEIPKQGKERAPKHRYAFPEQDTEIEVGDALFDQDGVSAGTAIAIEPGTIDIRLPTKREAGHPRSVYAYDTVPTDVMADSLLRVGEWTAEHGVDGGGPDSMARAGRDLLLGHPPRRRPEATGLLRQDDETAAEAARRLATELDGGCLPIQGPPGAGKTYAGGRMIVELARQGKRVGVTAVSHKVIENLLSSAIEAADKEKVPLTCWHKVTKTSQDPPKGITETTANGKALAALEGGEAQVLGGTTWLWSSPDATGAVDVLFVDEAGQMSLANVLAVSPAARSIVLLGDPQQLEQPQKGSHPEGTEVSALQHVLGEQSVMPAGKGLFLEQSWRLHPSICAFTSGQFYDGELASREGMELQKLAGPTKYAGAGMWVESVEHEGNQSSSPEEVERVVAIVEDLLQPGVTWTNHEGKTADLELDDILVVAPYNAQVAALQAALRTAALGPAARVGTVDKFQGQEAPVVIYSMTASSREEAPRGMEFLYSMNRLNVATSRARCACVLVASPRLFEPECRTVRQMRLANGICAYKLRPNDIAMVI